MCFLIWFIRAVSVLVLGIAVTCLQSHDCERKKSRDLGGNIQLKIEPGAETYTARL